MRALALLVLCGLSNSVLAADTIAIGCQRLNLILATGLNSQLVERDWANGEPHNEAPAQLELLACDGKVLDRLTLPAPLAKLDNAPLRGTRILSYLVSSDLTAEAGSYNGPLTQVVQIYQQKLRIASAHSADGKQVPIHLALTGKAAWKKLAGKTSDHLLSISSHPDKQDFVTVYQRYYPACNGWQVVRRSEPGLWESDSEFPKAAQFPKPRPCPKP